MWIILKYDHVDSPFTISFQSIKKQNLPQISTNILIVPEVALQTGSSVYAQYGKCVFL